MNKRHLTISALALILMSACTDATGLETGDLEGVWTASHVVFTSLEDSELSVDLITEGASLELTLGDLDTYSLLLNFPNEDPEDEAGTYTVVGSTLTLSLNGEGEPEPFTIVRDGDSMTLTVLDEEFDFTEISEPAILVITLTR